MDHNNEVARSPFVSSVHSILACIDWMKVITATLIASQLVYGLHIIRGTPSPLFSTIPVVVVSLIGLPIIVSNKRKKYLALIKLSQ